MSEPTTPRIVEEAAQEAARRWPSHWPDGRLRFHIRDRDAFVAGAAWQAARMPSVEEVTARALREFADLDLHGLIPHSDIGKSWYHAGLDAAQYEARTSADRIERGEDR